MKCIHDGEFPSIISCNRVSLCDNAAACMHDTILAALQRTHAQLGSTTAIKHLDTGQGARAPCCMT